jgi:ABC-2 type transport system ATP-binding protein
MPGVEGLEIETPNLEEIYIGYMRARRPARTAPPRVMHVA